MRYVEIAVTDLCDRMYAFIQLFHILIYRLIQVIQPILVPLCFVVAWATVGLGIWNIFSAMRSSVEQAQRMHQIPCSKCQYFSGNYALKCPVHPYEALSEAAINCLDFEDAEGSWAFSDPSQKHV